MITVSKGVRISEHNITVDMALDEATRLRTLLLTFKRLPDLSDADIMLIRNMCDGLSGPLPANKESKAPVVAGSLKETLHLAVDQYYFPKRSPRYYSMTAQEQWEDDKKNGYLDVEVKSR